MPEPFHHRQTSNHRLESYVFADSAARAAGTGYTFVSADVGRIAYQSDTGAYYRLTDDSPLTWAAVATGGGGGGATVLDDLTDVVISSAASGDIIRHNGSNFVNTPGTTHFQAADAELAAIAGLTSAADKGIQFTGSGTAATYDLTAAGKALLDDADASAQRTTLGLVIGTDVAPVASPALTGTPTAPTAGSGTNTTQIATTAFVAAELALAVAGLLDFKGSLDASTNPNYPTASKGDTYYITVAGKVGGASGKNVAVGDAVIASADNAGGTEASVGTSWFVLEHNLEGALLSANNLSDLASAATARTNLGLAIGTDVQAYDAELAAIAGLTSAADKGIQFTGSGTAATYDLTAAGKALLDDADAAAQRTTLGLGTAAQSASGDFAAASHTHNASDINAGTVATARLGSGTADNTTFLRGDQTWATPAGGSGGIEMRMKSASTTFYSIPGVDIINDLSNWTTAGRDYVEPFIVSAELTISHICIETENDVDDIRIAIYTADENGQPVTLVAESGAIATAANTLVEYATTQTLAAGRYCFVHNQQTSGSLRGFRTTNRYGFRGNITSGPFIERVYSTRSFGAFTGQDWDTVEAYNYEGFIHHCFVKVSDIS